MSAQTGAMVSELRNTNDVTAATRDCPPEILSEIFLFASHMTGATSQNSSLAHTPWVLSLSSVCSRWREVAHSTPGLWTRVSATFPHHESDKSEAQASYLEAFLRRSGVLPLSLALSFSTPGGLSKPSNLTAALIHSLVDKALIGNLHRIDVLRLSLPVVMFKMWRPHMRRLSSVDYLNLEVQGIEPCSGFIDMSESSSLSSLFIDKVPCPIFVRSDFLCTLILASTPIDVCIKVLFQCTSIEECQMTNPAAASDESYVSPVDDFVTFPNLWSFHWCYSGSIWETALEYFYAPGLDELGWHQLPSVKQYEDGEPFETFAMNIPSSITTVEVCGIWEEANFFSYLPKCLEMRGGLQLSVGSFRALMDSARHLVTPDFTSSGTPVTPFPEFDDLRKSGIGDRLVEMQPKQVVCLLKVLSQRAKAGLKLNLDLVGFLIDWDVVRAMLPPDLTELISTRDLAVHGLLPDSEGY